MSRDYIYTPLKEVSESTSFGPFHLFCIAKYAVEKCIFVEDESCEDFTVNLSKKSFELAKKIKPGDIIRIHRLLRFEDSSWIIIKENDVIIFSSFKNINNELKISSSAKKPTLTPYDLERRKELENFLSNKLLKNSVSKIYNDFTKLLNWMDLVCQVVNVKEISPQRTILTLRDGTIPEIKFNNYGLEVDDIRGHFCISVWDRHSVKAKKLKKEDIIVIFNLENKPRIGSLNELNLRGGSHHGKCIRKLNGDSIVAILFKKRLLSNTSITSSEGNLISNLSEDIRLTSESFTTSIYSKIQNHPISTDNSSKKVLKRSLEYDDTEQFKKACPLNQESNCNLISNSGEFIHPSTSKINDCLQGAKKCLVEFPHFVDLIIPNPITIDSYTENDINFCSIDAYADSLDSTNFFSVNCKLCNYSREATTNELTSLDSKNQTNHICADCLKSEITSRLVAKFKMHFNIKDKKGSLLTVELRGYELRKLINVNIMHYYISEDVLNKVTSFIDEVFFNDKNPYLRWVIYKTKNKGKIVNKILTIKKINRLYEE